MFIIWIVYAIDAFGATTSHRFHINCIAMKFSICVCVCVYAYIIIIIVPYKVVQQRALHLSCLMQVCTLHWSAWARMHIIIFYLYVCVYMLSIRFKFIRKKYLVQCTWPTKTIPNPKNGSGLHACSYESECVCVRCRRRFI